MAGISSYALSNREIIERYAPMVYRIALNRTLNTADAEDVMQEVFLRYIRKERFFESEEHLKAYLIRSTVHRCRSLGVLRLRTPYVRHDRRSGRDGRRAFGAARPCRRHRRRWRALPPKQRDVVYLFYYELLLGGRDGEAPRPQGVGGQNRPAPRAEAVQGHAEGGFYDV